MKLLSLKQGIVTLQLTPAECAELGPLTGRNGGDGSGGTSGMTRTRISWIGHRAK